MAAAVPGESRRIGIAVGGGWEVDGRPHRDKISGAGHFWRDEQFVVVCEGETAPVKGPVVVMAESKAIGWLSPNSAKSRIWLALRTRLSPMRTPEPQTAHMSL